MDGLIIILLAVCISLSVFTYIFAVLSGGPKGHVSGSAKEFEAIIADIGPVRQTFTTHNPWRFRFGILMLFAGTACVAYARTIEVPGQIGGTAGMAKLFGFFMLLFGVVTMLYIAFARIDRLDLHADGLAIYRGKDRPVAAYYPDVREVSYSTVTFTTNGVEGRPIAKAILVHLSNGGYMDIGNTFTGFSKLADVLQTFMADCATAGRIGGRYVVTGKHLNDGTPEEVTIEARSSQQARFEALNNYGIIAERCELLN